MFLKFCIKFSIYSEGGQILKKWRWYDVLFKTVRFSGNFMHEKNWKKNIYCEAML